MSTLSRERPKELAHDYLDRDPFGAQSHRAAQTEVEAPLTTAERFRQRTNRVAQRLETEREQGRAATARTRAHQSNQEQQLAAANKAQEKQRTLNQNHEPGLEL